MFDYETTTVLLWVSTAGMIALAFFAPNLGMRAARSPCWRVILLLAIAGMAAWCALLAHTSHLEREGNERAWRWALTERSCQMEAP